ncbi:MAG TPA: hypothetical protein VJ997_11245 [Longimicrobiales bacterium]|nr:hypothetical protein [Longimicrobiales bacterium]
MSDHHYELVQRVITSLEEGHDPDALVWSYFDEDRDAVIQAAVQTLEATREDADPARVARAVDKELIEGLRFPVNPPGGVLPALYLRRGRVLALLAVIVALAALVVL